MSYGKSSYNSPSDASTESAIVADLARQGLEVQTVKVGEVEVFSLPRESRIEALEKFRLAPIRHTGTQQVADVPSFLKLVRYYSDQNRMVLLSQSALSMTCVLNFGTSKQAEWQDHKVIWQLAYEKKLKAWLDIENKNLSQQTFMEFLEDRIEDVVQNENPSAARPAGPSQSELQSIIGDLRITTDATFRSTKNLHNGNFVFETNSQTIPSVEVPQLFYLGLPVFDGARDRYVIPLRMRYRCTEGKLTFTVLFQDWKTVLDTAWNDVTADITDDLPDNVDYVNIP